MEATGVPALDTVLVWGGAVTAVAGVSALLWRTVRAAVRLARRVERLVDDWAGEPGRPGVPERPGLMARVARIETRLGRVEHELHPNDGASLRDAVDRTNRRLARLCPECDDAERHHQPPPS